jgi:hypothetical protein
MRGCEFLQELKPAFLLTLIATAEQLGEKVEQPGRN